MDWLSFVPLPFILADLAMCRDERAMRRRGHQAFRQLSREDQRAVGRALRRGEAVDAERLAVPVLAWTATRDSSCPWGQAFLAVFLATFLVRAGLAMYAGEWKAAAIILLSFDFFALLVGFGATTRQRARQTAVATRRRFPGA